MACFATSKRVKQGDTNLIDAPDCVSMKGGLCKVIEEAGGGVRQSCRQVRQEGGTQGGSKLQIEIWKSEAGEIHSIKACARHRISHRDSQLLEFARRSTYNNSSLTYLPVRPSVLLSVCLSVLTSGNICGMCNIRYLCGVRRTWVCKAIGVGKMEHSA